MNGTINWLSVVGLVVEIAGLLFLFFDLRRTKERDKGADAVGSFQQNLESGGRDIVIKTHESFVMVVDAMAKLIALDMDKAVPRDIRAGMTAAFERARETLASREDLDKMLASELVAKASILQSFKQQVSLAESLKRVVTIGIALVLVGACLQLAAQII